MIRKAEELKIDLEPNLKGGEGTVRIINYLEEEFSGGAGRLFGISIIPPGGSIGYHRHVGDFEIYYILEGKAKVVDNGREDTLAPGDSMVCFEGDSHSIENIGEGDLRYVAIILYTQRKPAGGSAGVNAARIPGELL